MLRVFEAPGCFEFNDGPDVRCILVGYMLAELLLEDLRERAHVPAKLDNAGAYLLNEKKSRHHHACARGRPCGSFCLQMEGLPPKPLASCDCSRFASSNRIGGSKSQKATTVTRIATPTPTIPVTADSFQNARASEGLKTMTATRTVTPTPDPCDCFDFSNSNRIRGSKNDDS